MHDKNPFSNEYISNVNLTDADIKKEKSKKVKEKISIQDEMINRIDEQYKSRKPIRKIIKAKIV